MVGTAGAEVDGTAVEAGTAGAEVDGTAVEAGRVTMEVGIRILPMKWLIQASPLLFLRLPMMQTKGRNRSYKTPQTMTTRRRWTG